MFPFKRRGVLSFQVGSEIAGDQELNESVEDQIIMENHNLNPTGGRNKRGQGRGRKSSLSSANTIINSNDSNNDNYDTKKIIHRDIERQRRQEMSTLHSSLRSILPPEYVKGKRSISDHVAEAVNYIKDLEKNVKELREKRDQLIKSTPSSKHEPGRPGNPLPGTVEIRQFVGGLEVEITVGYDEDFLLSTAIRVAHEEGLCVVSCASTKINDRLVHNLQSEVGDITCIDVIRLHQRLMDLVC